MVWQSLLHCWLNTAFMNRYNTRYFHFHTSGNLLDFRHMDVRNNFQDANETASPALDHTSHRTYPIWFAITSAVTPFRVGDGTGTSSWGAAPITKWNAITVITVDNTVLIVTPVGSTCWLLQATAREHKPEAADLRRGMSSKVTSFREDGYHSIRDFLNSKTYWAGTVFLVRVCVLITAIITTAMREKLVIVAIFCLILRNCCYFRKLRGDKLDFPDSWKRLTFFNLVITSGGVFAS